MRGFSSAGRAPALQAGGHRFESGNLHQDWIEVFGQWSEHFNLTLKEARSCTLKTEQCVRKTMKEQATEGKKQNVVEQIEWRKLF